MAGAASLKPNPGDGLEKASTNRLPLSFFDRSVHDVARDLIGCRLFYEGCGGTIVETESYERDDPACHAYVGLTERTKVLFGPPGRARRRRATSYPSIPGKPISNRTTSGRAVDAICSAVSPLRAR